MRKYAAKGEGRMTVEVQSYVQGVANRIPFPVTISNVLAKVKGAEDPSRVYVMTGHYDSRVTDVLDYQSDAPGANDDASGVASKSPARITSELSLTYNTQSQWSLLESFRCADLKLPSSSAPWQEKSKDCMAQVISPARSRTRAPMLKAC